MTAHILVVDDEPDVEALILQKFRHKIRDGAITFLFARDGVDALAALKANGQIDLAVTDINMPRMDGLSLLLVSAIGIGSALGRVLLAHFISDARRVRFLEERTRQGQSKQSGRGYRLIYATLELGVELHDRRIHERQDLRQDNAGDTLRRVDPEIGVGQPGPGQAAAAAASGTLLRIDQEA